LHRDNAIEGPKLALEEIAEGERDRDGTSRNIGAEAHASRRPRWCH
jgi:hypothetical protein